MIVFWGDHGWHLGEKQHWGKWTGWERATHVPLIIAPARNPAMEIYRSDAKCAEPVSLLDLYPTLIEMCGLPSCEGSSGRTLAPLMKNPTQATQRTVLTTFDRGNYSVMGSRWHYIRYASGDEELYDLSVDPNEWNNIAGESQQAAMKQEMAKLIPLAPAPAPGGGSRKP